MLSVEMQQLYKRKMKLVHIVIFKHVI